MKRREGCTGRFWQCAALSACAVCLLAFAPGSALARRIGAGEAPTAIVDAAGTAYVAYNASDGDVDLCAIAARGPFGCTPHPVVADSNDAEAQPPLLASPGANALELVSARGGDNEYYVSSDAGQAFADVGRVGDGLFFDGAIGPAGNVVTDTYILGFKASVGSVAAPAPPTSGPIATAGEGVLLAGGAGEQVAAWAGRTPIVVRSNAVQGTYAYSLVGPNQLKRHDWRPQRIGRTNELAIANGPYGIYVLQQPFLSGRLSLTHRGRNGRFSPQRLAPRSILDADVGGVALAQDGQGRLIAAWYTEPGDTLVAAVSTDGIHWTAHLVLARHVPLIGRMSIAVGRHGHGVLVWEPNGGGTVNALKVSIPSFLPTRPRRRAAG